MKKGALHTVVLSAFLMVNCLFFAGCAKKPAQNPEQAFLEFSKALLFNRREQMKVYGTDEYIRQLEAVFDMIVISASWPGNATIAKSETVGDKAVLLVNGLDRQNKHVAGAFEAAKTGTAWKIINGGWITPLEGETTVSPDMLAEQSYQEILNRLKGITPTVTEYPFNAASSDSSTDASESGSGD